jgi:Skp family chaperone for outer membrane proteins
MAQKTFLISLVLMLVSVVLADEKSQTVKIIGYVVDNMCAAAHKDDKDVLDTVKTHPKECALMDDCLKSGYAVLTEDGKFYKLDEAGNKKVVELLKKSKSEKGLMVTVEGTIEGDTLRVKTISEAKANS